MALKQNIFWVNYYTRQKEKPDSIPEDWENEIELLASDGNQSAT